jgi:anti-sigma factor RsiW
MKSAVKSAHSKMESVSPENLANEELTRYLLGEMSEAEQMQMEIRYFADPQMFAELCSWRNNLIDGYVAGELSPSLRERFEAGIENSWAVNERVRFAETLQEAIEMRTATSPPYQAPRTLRTFDFRYRKLLIVAAFLLIFLMALWLILRLVETI